MWHRVLFQIFLHVIFNVCNLLLRYHNGRSLIGRYQGFMFWNNAKLFCQFFINFLLIIRTKLWLLAQSKVNFSSSHFKKNRYLWDGSFSILLLRKSEPPYIQVVYQNFISGIFYLRNYFTLSLVTGTWSTDVTHRGLFHFRN